MVRASVHRILTSVVRGARATLQRMTAVTTFQETHTTQHIMVTVTVACFSLTHTVLNPIKHFPVDDGWTATFNTYLLFLGLIFMGVSLAVIGLF